LGYHPLIIAAERSALAMTDLIHVPAQAMINDFPPSSKIHYTPQGLDKNAFDTPMPNPYKTPRNIISVGDMLFDSWAVETLARIAPDWNIHVFGKKAVVTNPPPNVHLYGERPFDTILPYIKYADLGMAPYRPAPDADYLSQSSLKMMQYTYCRLPIIAPDFAAAGRAHVMGYTPFDEPSVITAFEHARNYNRAAIDITSVIPWEAVLDAMLENAAPANTAFGE